MPFHTSNSKKSKKMGRSKNKQLKVESPKPTRRNLADEADQENNCNGLN